MDGQYEYEAGYGYNDPYGDYEYGYDDEEDEEMPATERELAEDAQWKLIQKNTFTRWANEHLKTVNKHLNDLEYDFADGLRLIALVEVLSGKKFTKFNRRPNFRTQKLENVTMCLKFLENDEGIRIVNIGECFFYVCWELSLQVNRRERAWMWIPVFRACVPPRLSTWREKHLSARPGGTSRREGRVLGVLMAGDWGAN